MKSLLPLLLFFMFGFICAQNNQVLFGLAETPQTLLLNPGAETNYEYHVGIPGLSGISMDIGSSGVIVNDLFQQDNQDFTFKVNRVLESLSSRDFIAFNTQIDILNGGYRYDKKTYFSFGFYNEADVIIYFPKDVITLLNEGNNAYINRSFSFNELNFKADVLGVLHFGVTRKVNPKLSVGGRFKLYSSSFNARTANNSGTFTTVDGENNIYRHYFNDIDINVNTSGIINSDNKAFADATSLYKNTFLSGSLGVGFDAGFTYHYTPQLEFTGSILDFGFIKYSKDVRSYTVKGSYQTEGLNFDPNNPRDYWAELDADFRAAIPREENQESYISWRPTRINAGFRYSYGRVRNNKECYDETYKEYYNNSIGLQLYTIFRPLYAQMALTGYYEKSISEFFHAKVTYTVDDLSTKNVGLGFSADMGNVNLYAMVDNLLEFSDIGEANNVSFQFGINLIFR